MNLFVPFVGDFVTLLTRFLVETETWESKNKLLKALSMTIERSEGHVSMLVFNRRVSLISFFSGNSLCTSYTGPTSWPM